jgi:hypothetical protein
MRGTTLEFVRTDPMRRMLGALLVLLGSTGCGGGDLPNDPSAAGAPAVSAVPPAQAAASAAGAVTSVVIRRQPSSVETREGSTARFSVDAEGPRSVTYQWLRDDEVIEGATGAVLQLRVTPGDHLARISVIVQAGHTKVQSESALLRVSQARLDS